MNGAMVETMAVGEILKWTSAMLPDIRLYLYRTRSGMEVDLLLETPRGLLGIEIKNRERAVVADARSLRALGRSLGREWLAGLVVHRGSQIQRLGDDNLVWEVPLHRLV